jgi:hypothetical protein
MYSTKAVLALCATGAVVSRNIRQECCDLFLERLHRTWYRLITVSIVFEEKRERVDMVEGMLCFWKTGS